MGKILRPVRVGNFPNYPNDFVNLGQAGATVIKKTVCYDSSLVQESSICPLGISPAQFLVYTISFHHAGALCDGLEKSVGSDFC